MCVHTCILCFRFKNDVPHLVVNHCMAHRLQLVSEKAANNVPYLVKYISIINQFAKHLKYSPKMCRMLDACMKMQEEQAKKIKQVFFTRWLSFTDSVQALSGCLGSVISCLQAAAADRGVEGRAVLQGLCKQMASSKFVILTHFLADAVGLLGLLSKALQSEGTDYTSLKPQVEATIAAVHSLQHTPGPHMKKLQEELGEPCPSGYTPYKTHDIKDSPQERQKALKAMMGFIEEVTTRLEIAFPDGDAMEAFKIFSPKEECQDEKHLESLLTRFSSFISSPQAAREEYTLLNQIMQMAKYKDMDIQNFFSSYLHRQRSVYPNIASLVAIGLVIPATSVDCERGISRYNAIKTDGRSVLSVHNADTLTLLAVEAKPINSFNFDAAFMHWTTHKSRRGYMSMMKAQRQEEPSPAEDHSSIADYPLDLSKKD